MKLTVSTESWPMVRPFRIAYRTMTHVDMIVVELEDNGVRGRGEGLGVVYHGENVETMTAEVNAVRTEIENGMTREELMDALPAGGARCAVDCALWDLECKRDGQTIWQRLSMSPRVLSTVYTIGIDTPDAMAENAAQSTEPMLKIKVNADHPIGQVEAVRAARPDARLIVDANQAFDLATLPDIADAMADLGVAMLEQPLAVGEDADLAGFTSPLPLGADESCLTHADVPYIAARYQVANIKLDKTGGLTEALRLRDTAQEAGLTLMVGCMAGTSLAMAPAYVIGQDCAYVDIDGPLLQRADREHAMRYQAGQVSIPSPALWG